MQFLQAFQDLPQDMLDNLQDIMVQNEAGMGMPGGMPGEIELDWADQEPETEPEPAVAEGEDDEDEDEDSEEDIAPMAGVSQSAFHLCSLLIVSSTLCSRSVCSAIGLEASGVGTMPRRQTQTPTRNSVGKPKQT